MRRTRCKRWTQSDCKFGYRDSVFKHEAAQRLIINVTFALPRAMDAGDLATPMSPTNCVERNVSRPQPRDIFDAVVAIRRRKLPDPAQVGNAGSFFKNPVVSRQQRTELIERHPSLVSYDIGGGRYKLAAGWLIEACGLKGAVRGRAAVYEKQALVLINLGGATGAEILALAREVQDAVRAKLRYLARARAADHRRRQRRLTRKTEQATAWPLDLLSQCQLRSKDPHEQGNRFDFGRAVGDRTLLAGGQDRTGRVYLGADRP